MWEKRLNLKPNESLRKDRSYEKGSLGQTEVELYSVLDEHGVVVGTVEYKVHITIKAPHRRSHSLRHSDNSGKVVLADTWE